MAERNPRNLPRGHFTAHIGQNCRWGDYCGGYQSAVEELWKELAEMQIAPDRLALPLLFLVRHTVELAYKANLQEFYAVIGKKEIPGSHNLAKLHEQLGMAFDELVKTGWVSSNLVSEFQKHYSEAGKFTDWLVLWDEWNDAFRYPWKIPKKGQSQASSHFDSLDQINLLEVMEAYDSAMIFLNYTTSVLGLDELSRNPVNPVDSPLDTRTLLR